MKVYFYSIESGLYQGEAFLDERQIDSVEGVIRAALRRSLKRANEPVFKSDDLVVDLTARRVFANSLEIQLTPTEYDLLRVFITHPGKVLTHSQILKQIWGAAYQEQSQVLRVTISNLRKKIERDPSRPRHITTEPGVGYRLRVQDSAVTREQK